MVPFHPIVLALIPISRAVARYAVVSVRFRMPGLSRTCPAADAEESTRRNRIDEGAFRDRGTGRTARASLGFTPGDVLAFLHLSSRIVQWSVLIRPLLSSSSIAWQGTSVG